ncbi:HAMP domain-containing histidine kinase [Pyxidicoccus fallax]|uniref:histidine kinase n=1 Tax=Pyxidicoccus fallax TaxID=394095 RepID=A0A848LCG3_9BACT|nr:HAMP domain-containing sensor histidine kinase [Pyxidicoccus fallax]NMO14505.1 HAMP domain-containing histidine kinase [Pyxidicoccus fallax]NPC83681.1 HAMP domain-containing histidine kinase [Pyxidicoccus fallax]
MGRGELQARERAAVADVVASTLRHDLRNKLASIRNATFYLMRQMKKTEAWTADPRVETFFQLIEKELASAEELLSKRGPQAGTGPKPRCHPRDGVERALAEADLPEGVRVERELKDRTEVGLDVEDLAVLVTCLVDNAVEAMPRGGTLTVRTSDLEDEGVCLRVEDTGEGLAPEAYSRAFEPFFTTRPGHAGLGLSIVHRMALRHGWKLDLGAGPSGGTFVEILFTAVETGRSSRPVGRDENQGSK